MTEGKPKPGHPPHGGDTWTYALDREPAFAGGQGRIWFARRSDGRAVAIKEAGAADAAAQSLVHEVGLLRALEEAGVRGVVEVLDVIDLDGRPAMVMPRYASTLVPWLAGLLDAPSPGTLDEVLGRTATIARILAGVHGVEVGGQLLHRDVKPENLFLTDDGHVVLGDFGGALPVTGLKAVELALFGSPMYAPLDQILPGTAIPDPTWDTYALCVILYAALTGNRPAYQADPRLLLTTRGRELWALARRAIDADGRDAQRLRVAFAQARVGTTASDLVDPTGHAALNAHDKSLLDNRIAHLAHLADVPTERHRLLQQGLWRILTRGLSTVSHPSPPNRFRDAGVLAEQLEDLRDLLVRAPRAPTPAPRVVTDAPPTRPRRRPLLLPVALGATATVLVGAAVGAFLLRYPPDTWGADEDRVALSARTVVLEHQGSPSPEVVLDDALVELAVTGLATAGGDAELLVATDGPADLTVVIRDSNGDEVDRIALGPVQAGRHQVRWGRGQPPGVWPVQVLVEAGEAPPRTELRVRTHLGAGATLAGEPVDRSRIRSWTVPVTVDPFQLDRTEVTWARWAACARDGACPPRPRTDRTPVEDATFEEARAFCVHAGGDLPTEAQWRAAHGAARHPWGDAVPTCRLAHGAGCRETPAAVGLLPAGATPEGVLDLAGNVWEWARQEGDVPVLLGGSVQSRGGSLGQEARRDPAARGRPAFTGLRCAYP